MSEKNIEVVRQFLATFIEVDEALVEADRLKEYCAPEATITLPEPIARELHVDQFIEFRAAWMEPYDDWSYEPEKYLDALVQLAALVKQDQNPVRCITASPTRWTGG